jgi:hypothetical protein
MGPGFDPNYRLGELSLCQCESGAWCLEDAPYVEMETRADLLAVLRLSGHELQTC